MVSRRKQPGAGMYWRTVVQRTLNAYYDAAPEQLQIPGTEPAPTTVTGRMFGLVLLDFADADGNVYMPAGAAERRYGLSPATVRKWLRHYRRTGWLELVGRAHPGHAQERRLRIPPGLERFMPDAATFGMGGTGVTPKARNGGYGDTPQSQEWGSPESRMGVTGGPNGGYGGSPPTGSKPVRSIKGGANSAPAAFDPVDLTVDVGAALPGEPPADQLPDPADAWLATLGAALRLDLAATHTTRQLARQAIALRLDPTTTATTIAKANKLAAVRSPGGVVVAALTRILTTPAPADRIGPAPDSQHPPRFDQLPDYNSGDCEHGAPLTMPCIECRLEREAANA